MSAKKESERPGPGVAEAPSDSFLRSDPLVMCEIVLPAEVAFECLVAVGCSSESVHIGGRGGGGGGPSAVVSAQTKHCRDLLMTLGAIKSQLAVHEEYIRLHCGARSGQGAAPVEDNLAAGLKPKSLFDLEASIVSLHKDLMELGQYEAEMNSRYINTVHLVNILDCLENVFWAAKAPRPAPSGMDARTLLDDSAESATDADHFEHTLPFTVGVVPTVKAHSLQLGIWRRLHLTALYTDVTVKDQRNLRDQPVASHNIFLIVTLSQEQKRVADRLCGLLGAEVFDVPSARQPRRQLADEAKEKLSEMRQVFLEGEEHRKMLALSGWSKWQRWFGQVCLIQAVYRALGQCSLGYSKLYYGGQIWCSRDAIDTVQEALSQGSSKASGVRGTVRLVEPDDSSAAAAGDGDPPTRMPLFEVTSAVRSLIYQFGVPRYREIDPTPFTAVTFPFLFAVMFGDWGHGLLLLAFSLLLFVAPSNRALLHPAVLDAVQPLRQMRHLLLLCALFAVYCGAVYNEGFGLTVGLRSRSKFSLGNLTYDLVVNRSMSGLQLIPRDDGYGMSWATDSMWGGSANQVRFFNSARMKLSIIFGFLHLMLGLSLQLANDIYAGRLPNLVLFSLVKLVFHCLLMGYPVFLIVYKWIAVTPGEAACAPALLPMLISMYRLSYTDTPCYLATFYPGQKYIEHGIVFGVAASALLVILGLPMYHHLRPGATPVATAATAAAAAATVADATKPAMPPPPPVEDLKQAKPEEDEEKTEAVDAAEEPQQQAPQQQQPAHRQQSLMASPDGEFGGGGGGARKRQRSSMLRAKRPSSMAGEAAGGHGSRSGGQQLDLLEHLLACFEFLLSSVSHSASYLRLWAIGLAHGELTTIMWPMLLMPPTRLSDLLAASPVASLLIGGFALALSFCLWASITVFILVGMEGMTALLHSLRLHWIEFQSKFYSGDGYLFRPFCLKAVAAQAAEACRDFSTPEEYQ